MNLIVQIANNSVTPRMYNAEVQPKIADSGSDAGRYPRDFERPRRLEEFYHMDCVYSSLHLLFPAQGPI